MAPNLVLEEGSIVHWEFQQELSSFCLYEFDECSIPGLQSPILVGGCA